MRGLEGELRDHRWDRAEGVKDAIAIERRYERLLRLRRLHAKVVTRERLAAL